MLTYTSLKDRPRDFLVATGLTHEEFARLLPAFATAYGALYSPARPSRRSTTAARRKPIPIKTSCWQRGLAPHAGKGGVDDRGANLWCMPVGGSVPAAPTGCIKPTACASGLRPA